MPTSLTNLEQINSLSFGDYAGLLSGGLQRQSGETTDAFLSRVRQFQVQPHTHNYLSSVLDLGAVLGCSPETALTVSGGTNPVLVVNAASMLLTDTGVTLRVPFLSMRPDGFWQFRTVSDVAGDINASGHFTATVAADGLAFRLLRQSSQLYQRAEPISGSVVHLQHSNADASSFLFSRTVPSYSVDSAGRLRFSSVVPANTAISYRYSVWPYPVAAIDVVLWSAVDQDLGTFAVSPSGGLAYQLQEIAPAAAAADLSYWSE